MESPILRIRIHYPARPSDRLVLRTSNDWDVEVATTRVEDGGRIWVFELAMPEPRAHLYFKACRWWDGAMAWSVGSNGIAFRGARDAYPHFDGGSAGAISDRFAIGSRPVRVYVPSGYDENTLKRYPVLYVHDGANVFFRQEAFSGVDWEIGSTLDVLDQMHLIDRVVVVALYASPERRDSEYSPPGWSDYADELVERIERIVPAIRESYRILDRPSDTAVLGSSLGGVVSLYLAWRHPEVFGLCGCLSSPFGALDALETAVLGEPKPSIRVYLDSGWPGDNHDATVTMRDALLCRGFVMGADLLHLGFPGARHDEGSWAERLPLPFQFLFGHAFRSRR